MLTVVVGAREGSAEAGAMGISWTNRRGGGLAGGGRKKRRRLGGLTPRAPRGGERGGGGGSCSAILQKRVLSGAGCVPWTLCWAPAPGCLQVWRFCCDFIIFPRCDWQVFFCLCLDQCFGLNLSLRSRGQVHFRVSLGSQQSLSSGANPSA